MVGYHFIVRTVKIFVRNTFTSESTGFKNSFDNKLPDYSEIELNVFDLVASSTRKGPTSIVFGKLFLAGTF